MTAHSHTAGNGALTVRNNPSPRVMALAYRIHGYASPRGWDCTVVEIAEALDVPSTTVRNICIWRGWNNRLRVCARERLSDPTQGVGFGDMGRSVIRAMVGNPTGGAE